MATAADRQRIKLRSIEDLKEAHEWLFDKQRHGEIDSKTADAMNTTLKGSVAIIVVHPLKAAQIWLASGVKKMEIPAGLLPDFTSSDKE